VFVRFSASDYIEDGWDREQTATTAGWAKEAGADLFDISTGGLIAAEKIPFGPGHQVPFADFVKHESSVEVNAVGLITDAAQAEQIVSSGQADAVMMGREMLRDPQLGVEIDYWPSQYLRAKWRAA
jgi:2,4-dienoyl-CoA reductase-like NADH-dependent reductase (Old Yellow Enzyme family)